MKYYLETNALRGLGKDIIKNEKLLKNSYTSILSIFELMKGIDSKTDSKTRLNILRNITDINLTVIEMMPSEMLLLSFNRIQYDFELQLIKENLKNHLMGRNVISIEYENLLNFYENFILSFFNTSTKQYAKPKPKPTFIKLDNFNDYIISGDSQLDLDSSQNNLNVEPYQMVVEKIIRKSEIPNIYRFIFKDFAISDEQILSNYNGRLDLFLFAFVSYNLARKVFREGGKKNDLFDLLHTIYLFDSNKIIVSDDKIFTKILPHTKIISIDDYKNLLN